MTNEKKIARVRSDKPGDDGSSNKSSLGIYGYKTDTDVHRTGELIRAQIFGNCPKKSPVTGKSVPLMERKIDYATGIRRLNVMRHSAGSNMNGVFDEEIARTQELRHVDVIEKRAPCGRSDKSGPSGDSETYGSYCEKHKRMFGKYGCSLCQREELVARMKDERKSVRKIDPMGAREQLKDVGYSEEFLGHYFGAGGKKISTEHIKELIPTWLQSEGLNIEGKWKRVSKKKSSNGRVQREFITDEDDTLTVITDSTDTKILSYSFEGMEDENVDDENGDDEDNDKKMKPSDFYFSPIHCPYDEDEHSIGYAIVDKKVFDKEGHWDDRGVAHRVDVPDGISEDAESYFSVRDGMSPEEAFRRLADAGFVYNPKISMNGEEKLPDNVLKDIVSKSSSKNKSVKPDKKSTVPSIDWDVIPHPDSHDISEGTIEDAEKAIDKLSISQVGKAFRDWGDIREVPDGEVKEFAKDMLHEDYSTVFTCVRRLGVKVRWNCAWCGEERNKCTCKDGQKNADMRSNDGELQEPYEDNDDEDYESPKRSEIKSSFTSTTYDNIADLQRDIPSPSSIGIHSKGLTASFDHKSYSVVCGDCGEIVKGWSNWGEMKEQDAEPETTCDKCGSKKVRLEPSCDECGGGKYSAEDEEYEYGADDEPPKEEKKDEEKEEERDEQPKEEDVGKEDVEFAKIAEPEIKKARQDLKRFEHTYVGRQTMAKIEEEAMKLVPGRFPGSYRVELKITAQMVAWTGGSTDWDWNYLHTHDLGPGHYELVPIIDRKTNDIAVDKDTGQQKMKNRWTLPGRCELCNARLRLQWYFQQKEPPTGKLVAVGVVCAHTKLGVPQDILARAYAVVTKFSRIAAKKTRNSELVAEFGPWLHDVSVADPAGYITQGEHWKGKTEILKKYRDTRDVTPMLRNIKYWIEREQPTVLQITDEMKVNMRKLMNDPNFIPSLRDKVAEKERQLQEERDREEYERLVRKLKTSYQYEEIRNRIDPSMYKTYADLRRAMDNALVELQRAEVEDRARAIGVNPSLYPTVTELEVAIRHKQEEDARKSVREEEELRKKMEVEPVDFVAKYAGVNDFLSKLAGQISSGTPLTAGQKSRVLEIKKNFDNELARNPKEFGYALDNAGKVPILRPLITSVSFGEQITQPQLDKLNDMMKVPIAQVAPLGWSPEEVNAMKWFDVNEATIRAKYPKNWLLKFNPRFRRAYIDSVRYYYRTNTPMSRSMSEPFVKEIDALKDRLSKV